MDDLNRISSKSSAFSSPARITIIYFIAGSIWIFFSDTILTSLVSDAATIKWISIYKGWFFVIITGSLLFILIKKAETHRDELQKELIKSEQKYRTIVETFYEVVWTFDEAGRITFINNSCRSLFGREPEEMMGKIFLQYVAPENRNSDMEFFQKTISAGRDMTDYNTRVVDKQGNVKDVIVNATTIKPSGNGNTLIYGTIFDITERKKHEELLTSSEEKYRKLVESSHGLVWALDKDFMVTFVNQASVEVIGYEPSEIIGKHINSIVPPRYSKKVREILDEAIKSRKSKVQFESVMINKNGNQVFSLVNLALLYDSNGIFTGAMSASVDITEREKIEEQVRISEEKYRTIVETANEGIWITDKDNKTTFVNRTLAKMLGYEVREMLGRLIFEFIEIGDAANSKERFLTGNRAVSSLHEFRFLKKNGESIWALLNVTPLFDKDENFEGNLAMLTDINEWKLAQDALKDSENRYRTVLETSPSSIRLFDLTGKLLYGNRQTAILHGYTDISEMIGMSVFDLMKGTNRIISKDALQEIIDNGFANGEIIFSRKDGSEFPAEYNSSLLSEESGKPVGIISIVHDISDKKKAEHELLENKERLSGILDSAMDVIVTTDEFRKIVLFNKSAEKLFKCAEADALGKDINMFLPVRFHDVLNYHHMKFFAANDMKWSNGFNNSPLIRTLDGEEIPVETSVSKTETRGVKYYTVILRDITERLRYEAVLKDANLKLHFLASHLQDAREEERLLISREIHDQVGQELTALKMDIVMLAKELERSGGLTAEKKVIDELRAMAELTDKSIKWIRNLATELRPDVIDRLGLFEAIDWHCKEFEKRSGIKCDVSFSGSDSELSSEHSIVFFRILQESLTNVLRHSGASAVEVSMSDSGNDLILVVKDNGIGIAQKQLEGMSSLGLIGMKERAYILGGAVDICGNEGKGVVVKTTIPKSNTAAHGK